MVGDIAQAIGEASGKVYRSWRSDSDQHISTSPQRIRKFIKDEASQLSIADLLSQGYSPEDAEAAASLLTSIDITDLAAHVATLCTIGSRINDLKELFAYARQLLLLHGMTEPSASHVAERILKVFFTICRKLAQVPNHEDKYNQELEMAYREFKLRLEDAVCRHVAPLTEILNRDSVSLQELEKKIKSLRTAVVAVHSTLIPPNVNNARQVPIDQIYVTPSLSTAQDAWTLPDDLVPMFTKTRRVVVLGAPGAGKTTLANYVAKNVCDRKVDGSSVAVPIVLREHVGSKISKTGINLLSAIQVTAAERYQTLLTQGEIAYLCNNGRMLVVLDGLDELIELDTRTAVTAAVIAFASINTKCRILATTRITGYSQAPLDESLFAKATIQPFSPEQVRSYAKKWFSLDPNLTGWQRDS